MRRVISLALTGTLIASAANAAASPLNLTEAQARAIVTPLYEALNEPQKKDVPALLAKATNPDYRSCSTETDCLDRTKLAEALRFYGSIIPDLHWQVQDVWTSGDHVVVRGRASGTPVKPLFGVSPSGKRFETISIDMFTVKNGKLSSAYHVENWVAAMDQMRR